MLDAHGELADNELHVESVDELRINGDKTMFSVEVSLSQV